MNRVPSVKIFLSLPPNSRNCVLNGETHGCTMSFIPQNVDKTYSLCNIALLICFLLFNFTLIPYMSRQAGKTLELWSVKTFLFPNFHRILEALRAEWRNTTPRFISLPEQENEYIKYVIPRLRIETSRL